MLDDVFTDIRDRMKKTVDATDREFASIRTGRASPALLDRITVQVYGEHMPLKQLATISCPQARSLVISPFDKNNTAAIEKAIMASDLGITPRNDGKAIYLDMPPLTEERRKELVKTVKKISEEMKVAIRNVRRDGKDEIEMLEDEKEITEDDKKRGLEKLQEVTDEYIKSIDHHVDKKEKEIMEF